MYLRRLLIGIAGSAAIVVSGTSAASASTIADILPPEIVALVPSASADAVNPLLPPLPAPPALQVAPAPEVAAAPPAAPQPAPSQVYYENCTEARNAGVTPLYRGEAGYAAHLDRDNDGIACE
ncbi:excalibur calcium-binding domain-containing protein [Rhodococcus sp. NPDC003318]|uniref:excalibur calcium-binding domain-containing protein n=1 Tax=Rhodococcus sp. NPDC003318 TaxID=3364503 RepID=UPI0036998D77